MPVRRPSPPARAALVAGLAYSLLVGQGDEDSRLRPGTSLVARTAGSPTGAPVAATAPPAVVQRGNGVLTVAPAVAAPPSGDARRYVVEAEGGLGVDPASFAAAADATLADPRSWGAGGRRPLHRVDSGPVEFRLVLASPVLTDELCAPLRTAGRYSCFHDGRAVVNVMRWLTGADSYAGRLEDYRHYVVNHEVGHALGHGHADCPGRGRPAPVMMQQTKGVGACAPSAWPFP